MKRFEITNQVNGMKFAYEADEARATLEPEWGPNPIIVETDITAEKAQKKAERDARRAAIKDIKRANTIPALKAALEALAKEVGFEVD